MIGVGIPSTKTKLRGPFLPLNYVHLDEVGLILVAVDTTTSAESVVYVRGSGLCRAGPDQSLPLVLCV